MTLTGKVRLLATCAVALCSAAAPAAAATVTLAPGQRLAEALGRAADGDTIEIMAGEYVGEVASIPHKQLTLRGVGGRPVFKAGGRSAEGKAILVVRDGDIRIENIEFRGARVADRNGAGIRFEHGRLRVLHCAFFDNENGILTAHDAAAELIIEDSDFGLAPVDTPLPHLIYAGNIGRVTVTGSRFSGGQEGHLLKSRARENYIVDNELVDGPGGRAAYELEFAHGGLAYVIGNRIGQSRDTTNPAIVSYGSEGYQGDREHRIFFINNTVTNEAPRPAEFLRVRDAQPPVPRLLLNNRFIGAGAVPR